MIRAFVLLFALAALLASPAQAQLGGVTVPQVPDLGQVTAPVTGVQNSLNQTALPDLRRERVEDLLRQHPQELEADPAGQPIVRSQILALRMSETAIAQARAQGFDVVRTDAIDAATSLVTLRAPAGISTRRSLQRLRDAAPEGIYDFDHLHLESGAAAILSSFAQSSAAGAGPRVGLIDSGVGGGVDVIEQRAFASASPVAAGHGTTIAALISSAAPGARLYAADIYGGAPTGGASSALARALAWLAEEQTPVINVSLVGPRNRIVEAVIARLIARGFIIVAAVGNDGPAAPPLFPAAYDGVVGVTGVDTRSRALIEAGRGAHVDFAARGVYELVRGTSYAAPIISARLATSVASPDAASARRAVNTMQTQARDLGARGRDDVYGYGLVESR